MSKFMNTEKRNQILKELMVSIRKNTQKSRCIDVFEDLLNNIDDKNVVDIVITDMTVFVSEFSRLCKDIDNMKNIDFISRILTKEFIKPEKCFRESKEIAKLYLDLSEILLGKYTHFPYVPEKQVMLSNSNCLGNLQYKETYTLDDILKVSNYFGDLTDLSVDDFKKKYELARKVILLYNYLPAVVKAFIQTKRRSFNLDRNSTKFK